MEEIIAPVERDLIKAELTKEAFLRYTNNGNNEVYLVNYHTAPNIMREIGRYVRLLSEELVVVRVNHWI